MNLTLLVFLFIAHEGDPHHGGSGRAQDYIVENTCSNPEIHSRNFGPYRYKSRSCKNDAQMRKWSHRCGNFCTAPCQTIGG